MDSSTTYIDTRISNDFNPNILPPGGWHTAEVCGEKHTNQQPRERIWNTVLVKEPPGSAANRPKQQQRAPETLSEPVVRRNQNHHDQFSFDKVQNWTISQIDDSMGSSMRRSFPQKPIVEPSAVQAAASPASLAPRPHSPPPLNDKKVRFSLSDQVIEELSRSYENIPFDPDDERPPAPGGIQAVSFNAEKLQGWTIMNLREFPLPSEMLMKENQIPGEMFITYVEDGKLKTVFLQKQTNVLYEEYENDIIRSAEHEKQNGVHSDGQKSFSEPSKFSEDMRKETPTSSSVSGPAKGLINGSDSSKLIQTADDSRRESQISNASSVSPTPTKGLLSHRDSMMMIQSTNNRKESEVSKVSVSIGPSEGSSNCRESVQGVQSSDSRRNSQLNGYSDGVADQKEPVDRRDSRFSLAGSVKDWTWEPRTGEETAEVPNTATTGTEQQEENTPVATQVLVNGQHYYVTKEDNAAAPRSTLRKVDSSPPSTDHPAGGPEQPTGPPDRPPPSYEVLDTVPKLPFDDNASVSSVRTTTSTTSSVRAAINATEDVLVQVTKGEGKSLHVNVRPPEGMSAGDIEVDLDLAILDENRQREPITEALSGEEAKAEFGREEPAVEELNGGEQARMEYRGEEPLMEELGGEQLILKNGREEEHTRVIEQLEEVLRMDELASLGSNNSKDSRRKKKTQKKGSTRSADVESVASNNSSENRRNMEKKKMRWSNLSRQQKQPQTPVENGSRDAAETETAEPSHSSEKRSNRKSNSKGSGQRGLARLTSKFKKSQKNQ
ncbi:uncharacterized protein [Branchiostoma lanceolatum]|uniref:uncharacterized protein n=1 Tax=Branchiostoma lanceolatum TaxID=7740 RepID=UPI003453E0B9